MVAANAKLPMYEEPSVLTRDLRKEEAREVDPGFRTIGLVGA
jgi:hypothetical protein